MALSVFFVKLTKLFFWAKNLGQGYYLLITIQYFKTADDTLLS